MVKIPTCSFLPSWIEVFKIAYLIIYLCVHIDSYIFIAIGRLHCSHLKFMCVYVSSLNCRQRRKKHKEKMKLKEKIAKKLQTHRPGEMADGHDMELFQLRTIKNKQHLDVLEDAEIMGEGLSDEDSPQEGLYVFLKCY